MVEKVAYISVTYNKYKKHTLKIYANRIIQYRMRPFYGMEYYLMVTEVNRTKLESLYIRAKYFGYGRLYKVYKWEWLGAFLRSVE